MNLFGGTIQVLEQSLNYATAKNRVIANNIANVDTPGYKAQKVVFKDLLDREAAAFATKVTDDQHIRFNESKGREFRTVTIPNTTYNHNGNNVDIDQQMAELAKNQIQYQALVDRINSKFKGLESVLRGGN